MPSFYVNLQEMKRTGSEMGNIATALMNYSGRIANVRTMGSKSSSLQTAISSIQALSETTKKHAASASSMQSVLESCRHAYELAEKAAAGMSIGVAINRVDRGVNWPGKSLREIGYADTGTIYKTAGTTIVGWAGIIEGIIGSAVAGAKNNWVFEEPVVTIEQITESELEKATDERIRGELRTELQDAKYSRENWSRASVEERKEILQDYMRVAISIYGLQVVDPIVDWSSEETYSPTSVTFGFFDPNTSSVTLNERLLSDSISTWDSYELIGTIAHELRHAYQHEAVDHPERFNVSAETIDAWKENFKEGNYIQPGDDYDAYRNQPVEVDARAFEVYP